MRSLRSIDNKRSDLEQNLIPLKPDSRRSLEIQSEIGELQEEFSARRDADISTYYQFRNKTLRKYRDSLKRSLRIEQRVRGYPHIYDKADLDERIRILKARINDLQNYLGEC